MSKLDKLKEESNRYHSIFRFVLNAFLSLIVGVSGLVYSVATNSISLNLFTLLLIPILLLFVFLVIITAVVTERQEKIFDKIEKEED